MSLNAVKQHSQRAGQLTINQGDADYVIIDPFQNAISPNKGLTFPNAPTIKLVNRHVSFAPNSLGQTSKVYMTPNTNDIIALVNFYVDFGCSYEIETGPEYKLTVNVPFDEITQEDYYLNLQVAETWEIIPTTNQKSLPSSQIFVSSSLTANTPNNTWCLPDPIKAAVYFAYNNNQSVIVMPQNSGSVQFSQFIPMAQTMLNFMRAGITSTMVFGQTLKRTTTVDVYNNNNSFTTNGDITYRQYLAEGNKGIIYSKNDMFASYSIPAKTIGLFMFPSYKKNVTIYGYDTQPLTVYAGYMVQPPTYQFITRNKVQITQTFIWDEWIDHYYFIPSQNRSTPGHFPLINNNSF